MKKKKLLLAILFVAQFGCTTFMLLEPRFIGVGGYVFLLCLGGALFVLKEDYFLVVPFIIYSPIQVLSGYSLFGPSVVVGIALLILANARARFLRSDLYLMLVIAIALIGVLRAIDISLAIQYFIPYLQAILVILFFALFRGNQIRIEKYLVAMCIAGAIQLIYKVGFLTNSEELISILSTGNGDDWVAKLTRYYEGVFVPRLLYYGQEPNFECLSLVPAMLCSLVLYHAKNTHRGAAVLFLAFMMMIYIQLIASYSRTGFVVGTLIFTMAFATSFRRSLYVFVPISIVGLLAISRSESLSYRLGSITNSQGASGRFTLWKNSLEMFAENPLLGAGFSNYYRVYNEASHNTYLQILAETGLLGLFTFMLFMFRASFQGRFLRGSVDKLSIQLASLSLFVFLFFLTVKDFKLLVYYVCIIQIIVLYSNAIGQPSVHRRSKTKLT